MEESSPIYGTSHVKVYALKRFLLPKGKQKHTWTIHILNEMCVCVCVCVCVCERERERTKGEMKRTFKSKVPPETKKNNTFTRMWWTQLWEWKKTYKRIKPDQQTSTIRTFNSSFVDESTINISRRCLPISRSLVLCRK